MDQDQRLVVFENKEIRRVWYQEEWWYAVIDVVGVLSESGRPRKYWSDLKKKLHDEGYFQLSENIGQLKMKASDGKMRSTDAANTETMFRIIQSIPSPKAEPFKRWFAKVAQERIQEIENPELAAERARQYYRELGYDDDWISTRLQSIEVRGKLTDEWQGRGVKEGLEYSILTAEISRATFGLSPSEYKQVKDLKRENLRDHMTGLEIIFTMLGEEGTRQAAIKKDAQGFDENKDAAKDGGGAAGKAREVYEKETGESVISPQNRKEQIAAAKKAKRLKKGDADEKNS